MVRDLSQGSHSTAVWQAFEMTSPTNKTSFIHGSLAVFERQILVFPLLVVILACMSFLFGGRCAAWQWWTAVATVVLVPFARWGHWRAALVAAGFFGLLLFALRCLIPPLVWDDTLCVDMPVYHLPMIQLLIEGWNPVADPTAEGIVAKLGLDLWGMAPLHIAFQPKTMAVFSAVAHGFVGDAWALTFPSPFLLWLGAFLSAIRTTRGFPRLALCSALVFILPMVDFRMFVDQSLAFASFGLLSAMQNALRKRKCDWLALVVWTAWMTNLKLNGVLGAVVFWVLFAAAMMWKERGEWKRWTGRFAAVAGILALLGILISWNPYGMSWRRFGHPLYPYRTIDAERFPVQDLTWDLDNGNDDFRSMGKTGRLFHAYVSPEATVAFYRWRRHRPDFEPDCEWWPLSVFPSTQVRVGLWLAFGLLLLLPAGRIWGIGGLLLVVLVPDRMAGYTRYQPWFSALGCLAVLFGAEWLQSRMREKAVRLASVAVTAGLCLCGAAWLWDRARAVECKAAETVLVRDRIRPLFWGEPASRYRSSFDAPHFVARYNYLTCMQNHAILFMREAGREGRTIVAPAADWISSLKMTVDWDERNWHQNETLDKVISINEAKWLPNGESSHSLVGTNENCMEEFWIKAPFGYYVRVDKDANNVIEHITWMDVQDGEENIDWLTRQIRTVLHAWFATYPREVWYRLI
jgi:hypothetical protein